jgi:hypothetical protein
MVALVKCALQVFRKRDIEFAFVSAHQIDETVEPLCVETRGKNLLAVHFTVLATACGILLASADLFTAIELGAPAAREARPDLDH